jgi:phosphate uptake regulator
MKRRIIKQGHNTLTVTLPAHWVQQLNINAGDEVNVIEQKGSLIIDAKQHSSNKSTIVDISNYSIPMIWRLFQSAYREGFEEIKIFYDPSKELHDDAYAFYASQFEYARMGERPAQRPTLEVIHGFVNRFIGMEIIDHEKNYCVVKEMGELTSKEFDNSLRRIFLLLFEMFDKVIEIMKERQTGDISICKILHQMDTNVDRFIDYCCRINNRIYDSSFQKNKPVMFTTLFILELLGDEFKYIGIHLSKLKKNVKEVLPFAEKVKDHFDMYYKLFYKFDKEIAIKFGENDFRIYNDHFKWKKANNKDARSITRHFMQISKFIFCLMELRIEMTF